MKDYLGSSLLCGLSCLEVFINPRRHLAPFGNGPDDEGGAAFGVASGKDAVEVSHEIVVHRHSPTLIVFHTEAVEESILYRPGETHRQQHQIHIHAEVAVWHRHELAVLKFDTIGVKLCHLAIVA